VFGNAAAPAPLIVESGTVSHGCSHSSELGQGYSIFSCWNIFNVPMTIHSALGILAIMRYIKRRFTYLLTFLHPWDTQIQNMYESGDLCHFIWTWL